VIRRGKSSGGGKSGFSLCDFWYRQQARKEGGRRKEKEVTTEAPSALNGSLFLASLDPEEKRKDGRGERWSLIYGGAELGSGGRRGGETLFSVSAPTFL